MTNLYLAKHIRICTTVLCLGLLTSAFSQPTAAQRVSLDKVVVIVDSDVVLQSELDARLDDARQGAARADQPLPPADQLRSELLDVLRLASPHQAAASPGDGTS